MQSSQRTDGIMLTPQPGESWDAFELRVIQSFQSAGILIEPDQPPTDPPPPLTKPKRKPKQPTRKPHRPDDGSLGK